MKVKRIHLLPGEVLVISAPESSVENLEVLADALRPTLGNRFVVTNSSTMNFMVLSSEPEGDDGEEAEVEPAEAEAEAKVFKKNEPEVILA